MSNLTTNWIDSAYKDAMDSTWRRWGVIRKAGFVGSVTVTASAAALTVTSFIADPEATASTINTDAINDAVAEALQGTPETELEPTPAQVTADEIRGVVEGIQLASCTPDSPLLKDPTGRTPQDVSNTNLGAEDTRQSGCIQHSAFDSVVVVNGNCTGTLIAPPEGMQVLNNHQLVLTAAHCLSESGLNIIEGDYAVYENQNSAIPSGSVNFISSAIDISVHPFYDSFKESLGRNSPYDVAILTVDRADIPDHIQPANLNIVDYNDHADRASQGMTPVGTTLVSIGYPGNRRGLTYTSTKITGFDFTGIRGDGILSGGDSGGVAVLPFELDQSEPLEIIGINRSVQTVEGGDAFYATFERSFIDTVSFLVPIEGSTERQCARVMLEDDESSLNRRFEPGFTGTRLAVQEQSHFGGLPQGTLVQTYGEVSLYEGSHWTFIQPIQDGATLPADTLHGFVHSDYLSLPVECPEPVTVEAGYSPELERSVIPPIRPLNRP